MRRRPPDSAHAAPVGTQLLGGKGSRYFRAERGGGGPRATGRNIREGVLGVPSRKRLGARDPLPGSAGHPVRPLPFPGSLGRPHHSSPLPYKQHHSVAGPCSVPWEGRHPRQSRDRLPGHWGLVRGGRGSAGSPQVPRSWAQERG